MPDMSYFTGRIVLMILCEFNIPDCFSLVGRARM